MEHDLDGWPYIIEQSELPWVNDTCSMSIAFSGGTSSLRYFVTNIVLVVGEKNGESLVNDRDTCLRFFYDLLPTPFQRVSSFVRHNPQFSTGKSTTGDRLGHTSLMAYRSNVK